MSTKLEYICKQCRSCKRFIVHYFNPFGIFLSNCVLSLTLKYPCKGVGMEDKVSPTLLFGKRSSLSFLFSVLSTPTLWSLRLYKPLQYVDWPLWPKLIRCHIAPCSDSHAEIIHFFCCLFNQLNVCSVVNSQKLKLFPVNLISLPLKEWVATITRSRQCLMKVENRRERLSCCK